MRRGALLLLAAALAAGRLGAQEAGTTTRPVPPRLTIEVRRDSGGALLAPLVRAQHLLSDGVFLGAVHNGFAVRFAYRLSLWRSATLFDRLVREATWEVEIVQNPVENRFELLQPQGPVRTFANPARLDSALAVAYPVDLLPTDAGERYYYVASLEVESLTASELEDVQRWLRGDVERAITGRGDVGNALTRGARMILIKLSGLPRRSFEARTDPFRP
ncbi:MAG: hypothetical protein ACHQU1_07700 [Gemmatimonadales bacterium]